MSNKPRLQVKRLLTQVEALLSNPPDAGLNKPHIDTLVTILAQMTGISADAGMNEWQDVNTLHGVAISPVQAAKCLQETTRTQVFMQGVAQAIEDKLATHQQLHILYAGTGPYGLLLLPYLALHPDNRLRVTLLDIHPQNTAALSRLITELGIESMISAVEQADATVWQPAAGQCFDLIISETMNTLLRREPQVWIFSHLQQFLKADGELIPQEIVLKAWQANAGMEQRLRMGETTDYAAIALGCFFQLDKATAHRLQQDGEQLLTGEIVGLPLAAPHNCLKLTTEITVYQEHRLKENQCSLTMPVYKHELPTDSDAAIEFDYRQQPIPEFIFSCPKAKPLRLPGYKEVGESGLFQIKRAFVKSQVNKLGQLERAIQQREWPLEQVLFDKLKLGLEPAIQLLYRSASFAEFEQCLLQQHGGVLPPRLLEEINASVEQFYRQGGCQNTANKAPKKLALSVQQWQQWQQQGYLVIPNVISPALCEQARQLVYDFLAMREDEPDTWYNATDRLQNIMVPLYDHPIQDRIRRSPNIQSIFEALWRTEKLSCSTDRMGFNPPERKGWQFPGPDLHLDLDFSKPVKFGTQGLIYLTDVTEQQGAFTCVPGFHRQIDDWLVKLPAGSDPNQQDFYQWSTQAIAAKAGSLIVWHQALPHGSSPNRADKPRLVQYLNMRPGLRRHHEQSRVESGNSG